MTDPYVYPGTGVLRNRLGLTDRAMVLEIEHATSAAAIYALSIESLPGRYDLTHLCAFHKRILGRIYPWAGEIRTVAIAKTHHRVGRLAPRRQWAAARDAGRVGVVRRLAADE